MEHLADKLDARGLIGVGFLEMHNKAEGPVFEGCVCWADDDSVPRPWSAGEKGEYGFCSLDRQRYRAEIIHIWTMYGGIACGAFSGVVPGHDIVCNWRGRNTSGRVCLHAL